MYLTQKLCDKSNFSSTEFTKKNVTETFELWHFIISLIVQEQCIPWDSTMQWGDHKNDA